jgi:murein DD-endopeptidase MepM/ murein hydrolase activator NlpD
LPDALRPIAAAALAVPVVASIYVSALVRGRTGRVALIAAAAFVGVAGFTALDRPAGTGAQPPTEIASVPDEDFRAVSLPTTSGDRSADPTVAAGNAAHPASGSARADSLDPMPGPTAEPTWERPSQPTPVPTPEPLTVVRFRPVGATEDVDRSTDLSVRFSTPMDLAASSAFSATIGDEPIAGSLRWAEGDTVLVLDPDADLPHGSRVVLRVDAGAMSAGGLPLASPRAISFAVEPRPTPQATPEPAPAARPAPATGRSGSVMASSTGWRWPILGPVTQRFGESVTVYGYHHGIDIDGSTGDLVRAARSGTVVVAGHYDTCGGSEVHIEHADGLVSWYRHLSRVDVAVGDQVAAGDLIGRVGNTGCSLGSHLHFAIRRGTSFLDPLELLPGR